MRKFGDRLSMFSQSWVHFVLLVNSFDTVIHVLASRKVSRNFLGCAEIMKAGKRFKAVDKRVRQVAILH